MDETPRKRSAEPDARLDAPCSSAPESEVIAPPPKVAIHTLAYGLGRISYRAAKQAPGASGQIFVTKEGHHAKRIDAAIFREKPLMHMVQA